MDIARLRASLAESIAGVVDVYERRPDAHQLIVPMLHEDGDMLDIYVQDSPRGEDHVRLCDFGLALMRLSYTFEINSPTRQRIFDSILINNGVKADSGDLFLDVSADRIYEGVLQFAFCIQKVCSMDYWSREIVRSAFYDDLGEYVTAEMASFSPEADVAPLAESPLFSVDWSLTCNSRPFFVFGVRGNDRAKNVAISLLEFEKARVPSFVSLVVHENVEELGNRERLYLTRNADVEYPYLDDFREKAQADIPRFAGIT